MQDIDFGRFHTTPHTLVRPDPARPPAYTPHAELVDLARAIERLDEQLCRRAQDAPPVARLRARGLAQNGRAVTGLEGNPLSAPEVATLLTKRPPGDRDPAHLDLLRHADFVESLDQESMPHRVDEVLALHARRFAGILTDAGRLKTRPNFIVDAETGTVAYVPTLPAAAGPELQAALDWLHATPDHPLVKAELFFHEFQSIHPFAAGNHRLGRLLVALYLNKNGYAAPAWVPTDHLLTSDKARYWDLLDAGRRDDWDRTPWLRGVLRVWHEAYVAARRDLLFAAKLPDGLNARQAAIADWMAVASEADPGARLKMAQLHAAFPALSRRTMVYDLAILSRAGVVERTGTRKGTSYRVALAEC